MVSSISRPTTVSRTSSGSSIDFSANAFNAADSRRTRKRITAVQLAQLEQLYRQSSHPTRDERDALAKRIQMETKSVTIWFQNKRQTDRKVALHNATNSRNIALPAAGSGSAPPNITITAPASPPYPAVSLSAEAAIRRHSIDGMTRKQPTITRPIPLKRSASIASSSTSTSATSTSNAAKSRPSLDRVASRSEIRFTHRSPLTRSGSATIPKSDSSYGPVAPIRGVILSLGNSSLPHNPPTSPTSTSSPLWATMLSSPLAPSSPPPAEYVAYTRVRRARTLEWACLAASGPGSALSGSPKSTSRLRHGDSAFTLEPAFPSQHANDVRARAREYEEATGTTEDEAELITPNGSQDERVPWSNVDIRKPTGTVHPADAMDVTTDMDAIDAIEMIETNDMMVLDTRGWEEDEMHAALALCGLRG